MAVTGEKEVVGSKPERSSPVLCRGHPRLSQLKETQRLWGELNIEGGCGLPHVGRVPSSLAATSTTTKVPRCLIGWEAGDCQLDGLISRALEFRLTWPTRAVPDSFSCPVVSGRAAVASPKMCQVHAEGSNVPI